MLVGVLVAAAAHLRSSSFRCLSSSLLLLLAASIIRTTNQTEQSGSGEDDADERGQAKKTEEARSSVAAGLIRAGSQHGIQQQLAFDHLPAAPLMICLLGISNSYLLWGPLPICIAAY